MNVDLEWLRANFPAIARLKVLGEGGQKMVFSGVHKTDGDVVLKLISPREDFEGFRREVLAVQRIGSTRVPSILEVGQLATPVGECFWLRESRVSGKSLREVLRRDRPLGPFQVLRLALHISEILRDAERVQIVHRDVKPDNIMLDNDSNFWLLDFGIARHLTLDSRTNTLAPFGKFTLGYAPVEQFRNVKSSIDSRADMFALGVTLCEAATGVNPFIEGASGPLDVLRRVETMALPSLSLGIEGAEGFSDFISAISQKRRDQRPRTAGEVYKWIWDICNAVEIR